MKTHKIVLTFLILFIFNIGSYSENLGIKSLIFKQRTDMGGKSTIPIPETDLEGYLISNSEILLYTEDIGNEAIFDINIINNNTGNIIYKNVVNSENETISIPLNDPSEGEYSVEIRCNNVIWEGDFQIEDENL